MDLPEYAGWRVKSQAYSGIKLEPLLQNAENLIGNNTEVLIIVGFHCDLTFMADCMPNGGKGLMTVAQEPNYSKLMNLVTCYDYRWRTKYDLSVFWALPYETDFLEYNRIRAVSRLHMEELSQAHEYEAQWSARKFKESVAHLAQEMRNLKIHIIELDHYTPEEGHASGSDGLHLGAAEKEELFLSVCTEATRRHPTPDPLSIGTYMTAAERDCRKLRRERSDLRRKVVRDGEALNAPRTQQRREALKKKKSYQQRRDKSKTGEGSRRNKDWRRRDVEALNAPRTQQQRAPREFRNGQGRRHSAKDTRRDRNWTR